MAPYSGHFFDGQTARKHSVAVGLGLDNLTIDEEDGAVCVRWPLPGLRAIRKIRPGRPAELTCATAPDARLIVDDVTFSEVVLERAPHLARRRGYTPRWWERPSLVTAAVLAFVVVVVIAVPWLAGPLARAAPDSWRAALGNSTEKLILSIGPRCSSPSGTTAMSTLVAALSNPNDPRPTRVTVINVNMVNAIALPGGKIVVMAKLLDLMETPDELAAVLAHEIGHVAERHPTEAVLRATGFSMFLTMLVGDSSWIAEFLAALGVQAVQSSYSREDERTADRIAAALMKAAGADPSALGTVFERLKKVQKGKGVVDLGRLSALLSTHPSYDDRIANARAETAGVATRSLLTDEARPLLSDEKWQALKGICADAGPEPASGASDEVGEQAVDVGGFFHVDHVTGLRQHVTAGAVG